MKLFDRFKKLTACAILTAFIPSQAWAQGITIPSGSAFNVNGGQLTVPGDITNAGTLGTLSGTVTLTASGSSHGSLNNSGTYNGGNGIVNLPGNWTDTGTINPGMGTVNFNASTGLTQNVGIGTTNNIPFWNVTHSGTGTVQLNSPVTVNNIFTNSTGTFNANSLGMTIGGTVAGNVGIGTWNNISAAPNNAVFTPGTGKVTFAGTSQSVLGSTTFYDFSKIVSSGGPYTLTFDSGGSQNFTHFLTMLGNTSENLNIRSTTSGTQAKINLSLSGGQRIMYVDVKDSNAGTVNVQQTLVANDLNSHNSGNNINWDFNNATITWLGTQNTNWNDPFNWSLGAVPAAGDTVVIPAIGGSVAYEPNLCPTGAPRCPTSPVVLNGLTIGSSGQPNASLTLSGIGLTVTGTFTNYGTVDLKGNEAVSLTQDTANGGTFDYLGTGGTPYTLSLTTYDNLLFDDPTGTDVFNAPSGALTVAGNLTVESGVLNIAKNSATLTVGTVTGTASVLSVNGGTLIADNGTTSGNIIADGSVSLTGGTLTAPGGGAAPTGGNFDVAGNFSNTAGTFNNSSGTVTFTTTNPSTISGSTTFYNFASSAAGKIIYFPVSASSSPPSVEQTVDGTFNVSGSVGNPLSLQPSTPGGTWYINFPNGTQGANDLTVNYSSALNNTITCFSCDTGTPAGDNKNTFNNDNSFWNFETLAITDPAIGTTVGQTPTIIGVGPANTNLFIKGIVNGSSVIVASVTTDANGNFRVVVGQDRAHTGIASGTILLDVSSSNSLTPYVTSLPTSPGQVNTLTVVASPSTTQVPTITSPVNGAQLSGNTPTITGAGQPGQAVTIEALIYQGNNLVLASVGSGTVNGTGGYSVTLSTPLPNLTNFLSATVNGVASAIVQVSLTDPYGFVFDSSSNTVIPIATVSIYRASDNQLAQPSICDSNGHVTTLKDLACTDVNPFVTGPTSSNQTPGMYNFDAVPGTYYFKVAAPNYNYPSKMTSFPAGRDIVTGSQGAQFVVAHTVSEIDLPMDGSGSLLRITKTANKSEVSVGDIVMYTVNIQDLSSSDPVNNVYLNDEIPPGFKYIKDRVLLNGIPISEPTGQRPLLFNVGNIAAGATVVLQYQLVVGSGVTMGNYQNTATARYANGLVISNPAQASVKIIPDPVFDLGDVIGKVFFDWNENGIQDPPYFDPVSHEMVIEKPVPNVQIVMEDGTVITTDRNGQYNIPGLLPGRHLFRLDERTLPPGAYLTTDKAVIVDVTAGSISKVNFGVNIDESQTKGRDAVFFNEKIGLVQDRNRPVPRLNAALFNASANAKPNTEEVLLNEGALVRQAEFRIFTNYPTFISSWHLDILDADTKKVIKSIQGTPLNINDPIYWNGLDDQNVIINPDHKYSYILTVTDDKHDSDTTKEKSITIREIKDADSLKKEREENKDALKDRADRYRKWLDAEGSINNLDHQLIPVQGETIHLNRQGTDVRSIHIMKGNQLFTDLPLTQQYGLTPDELMAGGFSTGDEKDNLEIILPNGDYTLDVVSAKAPDDASSQNPAAAAAPLPDSSGMPSRTLTSSPGALEHYSRPLKVGDDYMMFVALGDAQVGYNIDRGNIEPIQDSTQEPGFYHEGKGAYYLKGQILGKYLITSSYDSDRAEKALFRQLDPNTYYPVYGDESTVNYDAADTQGALYLKVEWDKSSAILGDYVIDFNDTDFAAFSQKYYGGMINYQSVSSNPYGDARTKLVVYHAQIQQLPSHNEFLATGGSLYFLKYKEVIQGSDTVTIQVRDQTTGLVVASQTMTNGADYELDNSQGSILFWQPVSMIAQSESIISNNLINGDPIYVVVDYQYAVSGLQTQGAQGARVAQAIGNNVVLGGTYVQDNSSGQNYTLEGTDATLHVNKDSTIKAEYAQTTSQETGSYVSTDGGITFTPLMLDSSVSGQAYGIKGDTRLFDNIGLKTYYKWIGNNFGATDTTSQQGTEKMGMSMTWDMTPVTRVTASEDIQRLLAQDNLQTATQIGASETDTTMLQIVHTSEKLKLTGQFQLIETKSVIDGVESTTNQRGATVGGQAQYDLTDRIKVTLGQQVDVQNASNTATTVGVSDRVSDHTTLNAQDVFSSQGSALTGGITNKITPKIALTTAYTLTNLNTGEVDKTASVGVTDQISKNITTTGNIAVTGSSTGTTTTTASVGTIAKISDNATLNMSVGKSQTGLGTQGASNVSLNGTTQIGNTTVTGTAQANGGLTAGQGLSSSPDLSLGTTAVIAPSNPLSIGTSGVTTTSSVGVQATTKVDENTSTNGSVNVANDSSGGKTTTFGFGNNSKLDQELQAVTSNSFSFSPGDGTSNSSKYGLVNTNPSGQKVEGDFTQQSAYQPGTISDSNIYGLSGDVNDKLAVNGSVQRGKVQNLGTSQTTITDFSLGSGYVLKDTESAEARLKNSIKLELRVDKGIGTDSLRQYVFYDAMEGKINDNTTANIKVDYSKTLDTTTNAVAERHQEIILGMAYRPVNFDSLNLITEYSYQDGYGGGLQQADALNTNVNQTVAQVFSGEAVYDINDQWQAAEKIAYRLENEQDTGFAFTQTHTWLVIQRLNYKIDKDWTISGELRDLAQEEAQDNKAGLLLQASREINANTELTIGWNFTKYTDDLTDLSYTSQGPFVRMTGKFYDETPEERARARAKWLDARINEWAWILIRKELAKKDSKIVLELNRMFILAKAAQRAGRLDESQQIYKDIISAGQIMYEEASEYIRGRIDFEEQLQKLDKTAREYFKGGEYVKARKIWEKVVEDASKGVVK